MDLKIRLQPKQRQFARTIERSPVTFYGGAKGGGKSAGMRLILLLRRFLYPGSHGAIFRRTFPEIKGNHILPLFRQFPQLQDYWNAADNMLVLPNGSTLQFCYVQHEADLGKYQGREFHDLGIEEAGEWEETWVRRLQGSNRSSVIGIKPRLILTGNPGGIGHQWLKRLFVEKRYRPGERAEDYAFIQALVTDNEALMTADPDYIHRLEAEPNEALRKAYRYGDWDIFAGQFFTEIRREVHLIPAFPIPKHWNRFGSYDYGFNHPAAFGWFATDTDGNVYLYREFIRAKLRVDQFAKELLKFEDTKKLYPIAAGHDCWVTKNVVKEETPASIANEFKDHKLMLKKATIDRVQGAAQVRRYLAWMNRGEKHGDHGRPRFYIFDNCPLSYDAIARMIVDPSHPEDVLKVDAQDGDPTTGDDAYDMIRYGLMTRPKLSDELPKNLPWGSKEWQDQEAKKMEEAAERHFEQQQQDQAFGRGW